MEEGVQRTPLGLCNGNMGGGKGVSCTHKEGDGRANNCSIEQGRVCYWGKENGEASRRTKRKIKEEGRKDHKNQNDASEDRRTPEEKGSIPNRMECDTLE